MKKIFPLLLTLLLAFGCNKEKIYQQNLNGEWSVYKYLLNNVDRYDLFQSRYPGYKISFTDNGAFTETYVNTDTVQNVGTYTFKDNDEKIVLTHTGYEMVDTVLVPHTVIREFTIFNLTKDHVQLSTDSSQLYMEKKM